MHDYITKYTYTYKQFKELKLIMACVTIMK